MIRLLAIFLAAGCFCGWAQSLTPPKFWLDTFGGGLPQLAAVDSAGRIYVAGIGGAGLPTTPNAFAPQPAPFMPRGFLLQLDPTGEQITYGTFLNGLVPKKLAVGADGSMYVLGSYQATGASLISFPPPITPGAAQTYRGSETAPVLVKIAPSGELTYGTFIGGRAAIATGLAITPHGAAIVCGATIDPSLPVSMDAWQPRLADNADAFVARVSADGSRFEALTYLGASGADYCEDVAVDSSGDVFVYGDTHSQFFPVSNAAYQRRPRGPQNLFVSKFTPDLTTMTWSTYIGSNGIDLAESIGLLTDGRIFLTGTTQSSDFPVTPGTTPPYVPPAERDSSQYRLIQRPFLATLAPSGSELQSAYLLPFASGWLGGSLSGGTFHGVVWGRIGTLEENASLNAHGLAGFRALGADDYFSGLLRFDPYVNQFTYLAPLRDLDCLNRPLPVGVATNAKGNVLVAGAGFESYEMAGVPQRQLSPNRGGGGVITLLDFSEESYPLVTQVVNAASLRTGVAAPEQVLQINGVGLGSLDVTRVLIDGTEVPIVTAAPGSVRVAVPSAVAGQKSFEIVVQRDGVKSAPRVIRSGPVSPAIFTVANTGIGQALAFNLDNSPNSPGQPALRGQPLHLIATGLGVGPSHSVNVEIGGGVATVERIGPAAGHPPGYYAIEVLVPWEAAAADFVPVRITAGGITSPELVTVAIR